MTISRPRTEAPRRRPPSPRLGRSGYRSGRAAFLATGPTAWYDARDLAATTTQTLANRVGAGSAQLGSTSGSDTNDPVRLPYDTGAAYVYLPGTANNNLSIVKGAWAGTLHVTATLTDDTTATFTTTADPVLIGNALLSAGRYKKFVVRDTDGNGTVRVTIEPSVETLGQSSWTCTTGQTVTVNRSTSGLTTAVVTRPLLMTDGTDDYVQLPAGDTPTFTATTGAATYALVVRSINTDATARALWNAEASAASGATLYRTAAAHTIGFFAIGASGNANRANFGTLTANSLELAAVVINNGSATGYTTTSGLSGSPLSLTGIGTISFPAPKLFIRAHDNGVAAGIEAFAHVRWDRALTAAELAIASSYLTGSYS